MKNLDTQILDEVLGAVTRLESTHMVRGRKLKGTFAKDIVRELKLKRKTCYDALRLLVEQEILEVHKVGNAFFYRINSESSSGEFPDDEYDSFLTMAKRIFGDGDFTIEEMAKLTLMPFGKIGTFMDRLIEEGKVELLSYGRGFRLTEK